MSSSSFLLASFSLSELISKWQHLDARTRQMVIGFGAVAVMALVLVGLLISMARDTRRHHHRHHHHHDDDDSGTVATDDNGDDSGRKRRKWRRRRRPHRPRNPTLAETGGLPPLRSEPPSSPPRP